MSIATVHGWVGRRDARPEFALLQEIAASTASGLFIPFTSQVHSQYSRLQVHVTGIEKPNSATCQVHVLVSTNGATVETGGAYDFTQVRWTATIALVATGTIAATQLSLSNTTALSLATATGKGGGEAFIEIPGFGNQTGRDPRLIIEHFFLNSASSPAVSHTYGFFASGPILGIGIDSGGTDTFSFTARVYGVGKA